MRPIRVLYLQSDTMGLHPDPRKNPLHFLSKHFAGDYLAVWWVEDDSTARAKLEQMREALGRFGFHWIRSYRYPPVLRKICDLCFFVGKALALGRKHGRYDVIITYGPFRTALAGLILRALTGAKLIVEFPGHPFQSFALQGGWFSRLKRRIAPAWTRFIASRADHLRLLYPWQLDDLGLEITGRYSAFHDFATVASVDGESPSERFILFLGFPYHLKGVDILIRAFDRIWREFPDYKLRIVGHCPDRSPYLELVGDNPNVEFSAALPHDQAMRLMSTCSLFVLPSRTEGMARVLQEAMAARRPVISSAVGGIPHYVKHGETGLLFEPENVEELAAHMRTLLRDRAYADRLAAQGHAYVHAHLSEEQYARRVRDMVARTLEQGESTASRAPCERGAA